MNKQPGIRYRNEPGAVNSALLGQLFNKRLNPLERKFEDEF